MKVVDVDKCILTIPQRVFWKVNIFKCNFKHEESNLYFLKSESFDFLVLYTVSNLMFILTHQFKVLQVRGGGRGGMMRE